MVIDQAIGYTQAHIRLHLREDGDCSKVGRWEETSLGETEHYLWQSLQLCRHHGKTFAGDSTTHRILSLDFVCTAGVQKILESFGPQLINNQACPNQPLYVLQSDGSRTGSPVRPEV